MATIRSSFFISGVVIALIIIAPLMALAAWSEPSQDPTGGNAPAPINTGPADQTRDGWLGLTNSFNGNALSIIGNAIMSGSNRYLNFGTTWGTSGYGIRDKDGTLEFKNLGGSWQSIQSIICALMNCTATHVSFLVDKNGVDQSVSPSTWTQLTWSHEAFDTNSNFANNRFTPTVPGKYLFVLNAYCRGSGAGDECHVMIQKNTVPIAWGSPGARGTASNVIATATIITDINGTTDYVEAYGFNLIGNLIGGNISTTNFSGSILSP